MFYVKSLQGEYSSAARAFLMSVLIAVPASVLIGILVKLRVVIELIAQKSGVELSSTSSIVQILNKAPIKVTMALFAWILICLVLFLLFKSFAQKMAVFYRDLDVSVNNYNSYNTPVEKIAHRAEWVGASFLGFTLAGMAILLQLWWANEALVEITRMQSVKNIAVFIVRCIIVGALLAAAKVLFFAAHNDNTIA